MARTRGWRMLLVVCVAATCLLAPVSAHRNSGYSDNKPSSRTPCPSKTVVDDDIDDDDAIDDSAAIPSWGDVWKWSGPIDWSNLIDPTYQPGTAHPNSDSPSTTPDQRRPSRTSSPPPSRPVPTTVPPTRAPISPTPVTPPVTGAPAPSSPPNSPSVMPVNDNSQSNDVFTLGPAITVPPPPPATTVTTPTPTPTTPTPTPTTPTPTPTTPTPTSPTTPTPTTPTPTTSAPTPAKWPTATETVSLTAAHVVAAGQTFDGAMKKYERSDLSCDQTANYTNADAVFLVQPGGVLKNVIVGDKNIVGVVCAGQNCVLESVWSDGVCQAAVVVERSVGTTTLSGGGARGASQRVVFHKASGLVKVANYYMESSGTLVESCATCGPVKRTVHVVGIEVYHPTGPLVKVNKNYKDEATIDGIQVTTTTPFEACVHFDGGRSPNQVSAGAQPPLCQFTPSAIKVVQG